MKQGKEIRFRKTGKVSGMCEDYMEIAYKSTEHDSLYDTNEDLYISLCDDVIRISGKGIDLGIDISKKDKKRFRLFISH